MKAEAARLAVDLEAACVVLTWVLLALRIFASWTYGKVNSVKGG